MIPPRSSARLLVAAAVVGAVVAGATSAQPPRPAARRVQPAAASNDRARPEMVATTAASIAEPTFAKDVVPIFIKNCTVCHHIGGPGPFPLYNYDSALAYTK